MPAAREIRGKLLGTGLVDVDDDAPGAAVGEAAAQRAADTTRAAGDQDDLVVEVVAHFTAAMARVAAGAGAAPSVRQPISRATFARYLVKAVLST